jgi:hypothetical protein
MKNIARVITALTIISAASSCAYLENFSGKQKPSEIIALERAPKIDAKNFFVGDLEVFAITQDVNGKIVGSFTGKMSGKWDENKGVLQQTYISEVGKKDNRTWLITTDSDDTFTAVGHDMTTPIKGRQLGNVMQMTYTLSISQKEGGKQETTYEDNIYLVDERSALGISLIKKGKVASGKSIISYKKIAKSDSGKNE